MPLQVNHRHTSCVARHSSHHFENWLNVCLLCGPVFSMEQDHQQMQLFRYRLLQRNLFPTFVIPKIVVEADHSTPSGNNAMTSSGQTALTHTFLVFGEYRQEIPFN